MSLAPASSAFWSNSFKVLTPGGLFSQYPTEANGKTFFLLKTYCHDNWPTLALLKIDMVGGMCTNCVNINYPANLFYHTSVA